MSYKEREREQEISVRCVLDVSLFSKQCPTFPFNFLYHEEKRVEIVACLRHKRYSLTALVTQAR